MSREDAIERVQHARFLQQVEKIEDMFCKQNICRGSCACRRCEDCDFERELNKKKKQFKK